MKKLLHFTIFSMLVTVIALSGLTGTAYATGGGNPHKDSEPQKQSLIKKEAGETKVESKEESSQKHDENKPEEEYHVELFIEPNPLIKGPGELLLEIQNAKSEAVMNAKVTATISMDPKMDGHGTMTSEPQDVTLVFDEKLGQYKGEVELTDVGKMNAKVNVDYLNGQKDSLSTTFEVIYDGPSLIFLWSIFGIIVISIIYAQVIKMKQQQLIGGESNVRV